MTTCTAECGTGTWDNNNVCTACTPITGAASSGVTYTCTSTTDTRFATGGCATATPKKTVGTTGMTTCTAECGTGTWDNNNVCTTCTAIPGAATSGVTYTCTSATNTRFATGGCATSSTTKKTVGATNIMTTCTAACHEFRYDDNNVCRVPKACGNIHGVYEVNSGHTLLAYSSCPSTDFVRVQFSILAVDDHWIANQHYNQQFDKMSNMSSGHSFFCFALFHFFCSLHFLSLL